jgi:Carboxypeptidase regulatory-like domain
MKSSMKPWKRALALLGVGIGLSLSLSLNGCGPTGQEPLLVGPCTETGNPTGIIGKVFDTKGQPASGAVVKLFQRTGTELNGIATAISQTTTCSDGSFSFAKLAAATYALEANDSASGKTTWFAKAEIADTADNLRVRMVLASPGEVMGKVSRGSNLVPAGIVRNEKILVRLIHTDKSFITDTSGAYHFPMVGAGVYRAVFTALDGHYLSAYRDSILVIAGQRTLLPLYELKWSPFATPPIPTMPSVELSDSGVTLLKWHPVLVENFSHYEILRKDSLDEFGSDTLITTDTMYLDTLKSKPIGYVLNYQVRSVNTLGNKSDWSMGRMTVIPPDAVLSDSVDFGTRVLLNGKDMASIPVKLYRIPTVIGSPDALPLGVDSAGASITDLDGRVHFKNLAKGRYFVEAADPISHKKAAANIELFTGKVNAEVSLDLKTTGLLRGTVTRQSLWVSAPFKGNENIQISLAGTPYKVYSENGSPYSPYTMKGIPAGQYHAVFYAPPIGFFLPDTVRITILAGDSVVLPLVPARYNPAAPPPKLFGLKIGSVIGTKIHLEWETISNYPFLGGYEVLRLDMASNILASSGTLKTASWVDDVKDIASNTRITYVVRVLNLEGMPGANGGNSSGEPVPYQVP